MFCLFFKVESTPLRENRQWEQEQEVRQETLQKQCGTLKVGANITGDWLNKNKYKLRSILVSDKHKALYCYVPKVACTNWKQVFLVMNGKSTHNKVKALTLSEIHATKQPTLDQHSTYDILHRLQTYKTFLFVRNPFSRMLSVYREKFETADTDNSRMYREDFGNRIHIRYGNHSELKGKKPPTGGYNVTFQEFVKFVVDPKLVNIEGKGLQDQHWMPMIYSCLPCTVDYDIIGHLETLEIDAANILEQIGGSEYMDLVVGKSRHGTDSSQRKTLRKYFAQLTDEELQSLIYNYWYDFKVFGYSMNIPV